VKRPATSSRNLGKNDRQFSAKEFLTIPLVGLLNDKLIAALFPSTRVDFFSKCGSFKAKPRKKAGH
jgi:hypothetical protein